MRRRQEFQAEVMNRDPAPPDQSGDHQPLVAPPAVSVHRLAESGAIPNNPRRPLLLYRQAFSLTEDDMVVVIEAVFARNEWPPAWRDSVYTFHHYHSTAHEVLGVYRGEATIQFGGDEGITVTVTAGDAVVIPAGVAHKRLASSADFALVGAYPHGQDWDMNYGSPQERPAADRNIARVPDPSADPIYGPDGPLVIHWRS